MIEAWGQYGLFGLIVVALAGYILRLENLHTKKEREWREALENASREQAKAIKEAADIQASALKESVNKQAELITRISDKMDKRQDENNEIIAKHISILENLRYLLERR
jgi:hypothetical protein